MFLRKEFQRATVGGGTWVSLSGRVVGVKRRCVRACYSWIIRTIIHPYAPPVPRGPVGKIYRDVPETHQILIISSSGDDLDQRGFTPGLLGAHNPCARGLRRLARVCLCCPVPITATRKRARTPTDFIHHLSVESLSGSVLRAQSLIHQRHRKIASQFVVCVVHDSFSQSYSD